ncbi:MAG: HAD-IIB family hydrolase [Spirochaetaceae bacterium]|nr:HAD-IIB family hydrolase [Spirochaetaceae bacterium]
MSAAEAAGVRYVLMDIDGTLTTGGKLTAEAFTALWRLHKAGLKVIPITGRPAGWCDMIAREWPVDGVVGENGAFVFWEENGILREEFHPNAVRNNHPVLQRIKDRALAEVPGVRIARDQFSRLFDLALDFAEEEPVLPLEAARRLEAIALREGAKAKISSIHVNVWMGDYDKLSMTERFLQKRFGWKDGETVSSAFAFPALTEALFVGDSPNDEPMFARFPLACAVANITRYGELLASLPAFVSQAECGEGFAEIVQALLNKRPAA